MSKCNMLTSDTFFFPTVKFQMFPHSKMAKQRLKYKSFSKQRYQAHQDIQDKDMINLIQQSYQRYKMQTHHQIPFFVNINFKTVSQKQFKSHQKNQSNKIKNNFNFSFNKIRYYSQGSSSTRIYLNKCKEKTKFLSQILMDKAKLQSKNIKKNKIIDVAIKNKQNQKSSFKQSSLQSQQQLPFEKQKHKTSPNLKTKQAQPYITNTHNLPNLSKQKRMSNYTILNLQKKYKNKQKMFNTQNIKFTKPFTPWLYQSVEQQELNNLHKF